MSGVGWLYVLIATCVTLAMALSGGRFADSHLVLIGAVCCLIWVVAEGFSQVVKAIKGR